MTDELTPVSKTALGVARIRAAESQRPDRLFDDPYAERFVAAMPDALTPPARRHRSLRGRAIDARIAIQVVVRTRFYDDFLLECVSTGIRQVVLVAAGLDARAFRLGWPGGIRVFELDLPEVLAFKHRVLSAAGAEPACERLPVGADLTGDWATALTASGFDVAARAAWLVEGLLVYLTYDDAARLLTTVGELSAPGSRLACEQGRTPAQLEQIARLRAGAGAASAVSLWQGGISDVGDWLAGNGWAARRVGLAAAASGYGRSAPADSTSGFVVAERR